MLHLTLDDASGADSSGAGNDMTCPSCPTVVPGLAGDGGNACDFTDDWYSRDSASLAGAFPSSGATSFTIAAWVEVDHTSDRQPFASKQAGGERGWLFLASHFIGGRLRFESWPVGARSPQLVDGTTPLTPGTTYHVAVTRDVSGVTTLYLDGTADAVGSTLPPRDNVQPLFVGRYSWGPTYTRYLDGRLDDVRIHDVALTAAEVWALAHP